MTVAGPIPTPPATLNAQLIANATALAPGLTANLPGSLIEDLSSTATGALMVLDAARVDYINALAPGAANASVLYLLGQQAGIPQGLETNTSVYVVFSGPAGYVIAAGFTVSDGSHQYVVQDGGIILSTGMSAPLYTVATVAGSWTPILGTVDQIVTSVPAPYVLTVTNPAAGYAGGSPETIAMYRSRVVQAGLASAVGQIPFLKTQLMAIPGVVPRLVSVLQTTAGWEVLCGGGGDPYAIAYAIYISCLNLASLYGSATAGRTMTTSITDAPDTYTVLYVNSPMQTVTVTATWNTTQLNFTAGASVNQLAAPAVVSYINSIPVGQPINLLAMSAAFQLAVASVLSAEYLTTLTFAVYINGTLTMPNAGTSIILGDPESYFESAATGATVMQG
jgi:hypothetical protein